MPKSVAAAIPNLPAVAESREGRGQEGSFAELSGTAEEVVDNVSGEFSFLLLLLPQEVSRRTLHLFFIVALGLHLRQTVLISLSEHSSGCWL